MSMVYCLNYRNLMYYVDCFSDSFYNALMFSRFRLAICIVLCIILFYPAILYAVVLNNIAGVIDGEIIPYRSVLIEKTFNLTEGSDKEILHKIIDRRLLLKEAEKFKITETSQDNKNIQKVLQDIKESSGEDKFNRLLQEYELKETDLLNLIKNRIIVERFIDFRINFFVVVSDDAIKAYYNDHRDEYGDKVLDDVSEQIKAILFKTESNRRLEDYLDQLRRNAKISINL